MCGPHAGDGGPGGAAQSLQGGKDLRHPGYGWRRQPILAQYQRLRRKGSVCRHFGNAEQPQNWDPALGPFFAVRNTRSLPQRGQCLARSAFLGISTGAGGASRTRLMRSASWGAVYQLDGFAGCKVPALRA